jgi:hypothetical protein
MAHKRSFTRPFAVLFLSILLPVLAASQPAARLAAHLASLDASGDAPGHAVLAPAAPTARLDRMLLLLVPPADRQQALTAKLASLQNSSSPGYHHWLTAAEFADSYANSESDVAAMTAWLRGAGFEIAPLPAGRGWIEFSGTVSQVEAAFRTPIYLVSTGGSTRAVVAGSIRIPAAFSPMVAGLVSLDGSLASMALAPPAPMTMNAADLAAQSSVAAAPALTPQLAARLLHLDSLHAAGTVGTGQTIAIATRSNVRSEDVAAFRAAFGLPAKPLAIRPNGPDPGQTADQPGATLLASWAGAAAPAANILLVPAATTAATDGLDLSLAALVDQALAGTVAVGYSNCEAALSPAHQAFYAALYRQAAAQGISIVAAAGDSGAAACHVAGSSAAVTSGYAVNALAATARNTAVGVAAFADRGATSFSAWAPVNPADPAFAGGGGASMAQARPAWQPVPSSGTASGQPAALFSGHRLLPDLAMPTAMDAGLNPGLAFCLGGASATGGCTLFRSGGSGAAAALVAGIAALIDQKNGAQGNLSPSLYRLANAPGVFADVAQGDAFLRCAAGTVGCTDEGQIGYAAAPGYDLATGLGVVNAQALVTNWARPQVTGSDAATVQVTTPAQTVNPSAALTLSATVQGSSAVGNPTGTVVFIDTSNNNAQLATVSPLVASGTSAATAAAPVTSVLTLGTHNIAAQYSGDANYSSETSSSLTIAVAKGVTTITVAANPATLTAGSSIALTATIAPNPAIPGTATPTGTVNFYDGTTLLGTANVASSAASLTGVLLSGSVNHSITAAYSGDANWLTSNSAALLLQSPLLGDTITLTASPTNPAPGQSVVLTATVTPLVLPAATAEQYPTGTVTFYDGTTAIGAGALTPSASATALDSAVATLSISTLPGGADQISAAFSGDLTYLPETSNILPLTIQNFTIAPAVSNVGANLTIAQGGAGSAAYVITGTGGFNGLVQVVCSVPAQDDMTCTATPQDVAPPAMVTFVVQTFSTGTTPPTAALRRPWLPGGRARSVARAVSGTALALLGFLLLPFGRRARVLIRAEAAQKARRFLVLLLTLCGFAGLGLGCTSSNTVIGSGTPLQVATATITASANINNTVVSQSVYLTVNVIAAGTTAP